MCRRLGRLAKQMMDANSEADLRHAVRGITDILLQMGTEVVDCAGRRYDPGMTPGVVEVREGRELVDHYPIIKKTIAPTLVSRGFVVRIGRVIIWQASTKSEGSAGADT